MYEIHVTVALDPQRWADFLAVCAIMNVKPLMLENLHRDGEFRSDMLTSSVHKGHYKSAFEAMMSIEWSLGQADFKVIRSKIETPPWNAPSLPMRVNSISMPEGCYLESHVNITITPAQLDDVVVVANRHGAFISRNAKKVGDETQTIMVTYRSTSDLEDFQDHLEALRADLETSGFPVDKMITEYALCDSNPAHDQEWMYGVA